MNLEIEPAPHAGFVKFADLSELEPHDQFSKWIDDHDILVYRWKDGIKAVSNICPHYGGPIGFHKLKEGVFTCLWHNYTFSAETGRCTNMPHFGLREYTIKIEGSEIWVRLVENSNG